MLLYSKKILIIFLIGLLHWEVLSAQNSVKMELKLSEALEQMMDNNRQIKIADYEYLAAQSDVEKMKSLYLPQVEAFMTGSANNLPIQTFGSLLQQGAIEQADFAPASLNNPSSIANLQTQIMVKQPLLNLDARAMKEAIIAKSNAFEQQAIRAQKVLRHQVVQTYLQLQLSYEMVDVLLQAKKTAEANLKLAQDNLDAGYLHKTDVLAVELRINEIENQLFETESNIQNASDQLSLLMGREYGTQFIPENKLAEEDKSAILVEQIPVNRSDRKAMQLQIEAHTHLLNSTQKATLPRINAFGSYELNNSLDFKEAQHGYLIGIQASWKIFNGNKDKNAIQKAKIELDKFRTNLEQLNAQNNLELKLAKRKMLEAQNKINLTKKAIAQSKESLRIKTNRFAEGLEKTTDILIAETKVAQKEMEYVKAIYQYQSVHAQILLMLERG